MKDINWFKVAILALFVVMFFAILCMFIDYRKSKNEPLKPHEGYQRTIEYVGFDGKKHQCIVVNTGQHSWVLVENK